LHHLLHARLRQKVGRHKYPTAGCLDSQSLKCTAVPGERGLDAGKRIQGRKGRILVNMLGWLMAIVVTAADVRPRPKRGTPAVKLSGRWLQNKKIYFLFFALDKWVTLPFELR
jgi:putative transposase